MRISVSLKSIDRQQMEAGRVRREKVWSPMSGIKDRSREI